MRPEITFWINNQATTVEAVAPGLYRFREQNLAPDVIEQILLNERAREVEQAWEQRR